MTYVITQKCVGVCDSGCINVCPTDCIHGPVDVETLRKLDPAERKRQVEGIQLFIDPESCIDCGACVPECPVEAVEYDDAPGVADDLRRNAAFFENGGPG